MFCWEDKLTTSDWEGEGEQKDNHLIEKDGKVLPWALPAYYNSQWYHLGFTVKLNFMCQQSNLKLLSRCQLHIYDVSDQERCFSWAVAESLQGMLFFHILCNECGGLQSFKKEIPNLCKSWILSIYAVFTQNVFCSYWETSEAWRKLLDKGLLENTLGRAGISVHYFQTKFYCKSSQSL